MKKNFQKLTSAFICVLQKRPRQVLAEDHFETEDVLPVRCGGRSERRPEALTRHSGWEEVQRLPYNGQPRQRNARLQIRMVHGEHPDNATKSPFGAAMRGEVQWVPGGGVRPFGKVLLQRRNGEVHWNPSLLDRLAGQRGEGDCHQQHFF